MDWSKQLNKANYWEKLNGIVKSPGKWMSRNARNGTAEQMNKEQGMSK